MPNDVVIDVRIPYGPNGQLGRAYNEAAGSCADWFLFVDHDVWLATNPWWYEICVHAIQRHGQGAGLITCYTNRIGNALQIAPGVDTRTDDLLYHRNFARALYRRNRGLVLDHSAEKICYSGFFLLSRHAVWRHVGGFAENTGGILHIDVDYCRKVRSAGLRVLLLADLYVYHGYFRDGLPGRSTFERPKI